MTTAGFQNTPLAIVGMACRFPGGETLEEFWSLLHEGRSAFGPTPPERLDRHLHFSSEKGAFASTYCPLLGQVSQRPIDRNIIDIPDDVAVRFDMTHLTLCEVAASACRHAGYDPRRLPYRNTGVYLGNSSVGDLEGDVTFHLHAGQLANRLKRLPRFTALPRQQQSQLISDLTTSLRAKSAAAGQSQVESFAANAALGLITSQFDLIGPGLVTDAACAASFTALLMAAQALHQGEVEMAIVAAGACRSWTELIFLSLVQAMSPSSSRPFDADADGLIAADGYGALIVKTLPRALADGDTIHGVVRGVGMSTDGRGKGFWAPRPEGQIECMRRALAGGADISKMQYFHGHATSTQLGDATEMQSLATLFRGKLHNKIPITSVKANIGHTLETAGMAGLIATLLAMKHATIPPAANLKNLNPEIPWDDVPFFVPSKAIPWIAQEDGGPRRAGVNAFGIGGLNTNTVIDDVPERSWTGTFSPAPAMLKNSSDAIRQSNEIAVIGVGCVLPGAHSVEEFRQRLASQEDLTTAIPADRWDVSVDSGVLPPESLRGGFLEGYSFNWKKHRIPPFQVANSNPLQFLLLDAADQAMIDSGYAEMPLDRSRVGTLVGAVFTNDFCADVHLGVRIPEFRQTLSKTLAATGVDPETARQLGEEYQADFLKQRPGVLDETGAYSSSTLASRVAKQLDFCGGAITIDAGDGSSLAALASGVQLLRSQECSLVMCCGGQRNQDLVRFLQLQRDGRLKSEQNPDGILPGEGAVALLLKRREDAERDGDRIRAILTTVDSAADARRIGRSHLESRASAGSASRVPATILVRTGDRRTDAAVEKRDGASASRFGELSPRLGHLQGGAAMVEILAAILDSESTEGSSIAVEAAVQSGFVSPEGGAIWRSEFRSPGSVSNSNAEAGREDEMDVAGNVFDVAVDWTGCPEELLRVESRIEGDLQLTGLRRQAFVTEAADRCGRPRTLVENGHLERNCTLGDLIDRLSTPTTGEAMPVSESSITN